MTHSRALETTHERQDWLWSAALFVILLGVYYASPNLQTGDSQYTLLTSEHLLSTGNLALDEHFRPHVDTSDDPESSLAARLPRHIRESKGHLYYIYPPGTPILSIPFVVLLKAAGYGSTSTPEGRYLLVVERLWQKPIAAFLCAAAGVLFFLTARLLLSVRLSLLMALSAGLGTQMWSTASRALWSHTWDVVLLSLILYRLLKVKVGAGRSRPVLLATLFSWAFFVRPTAAMFIIPLGLYVVLTERAKSVRFVLAGGLWLAGFVVFSVSHFGTLLPPYYLTGEMAPANLLIGLPGQLISPSRGLFVFVPATLFVLYLVWRHWTALPFKPLVVAGLAALAFHTLNMAMFANWWGGVSYGPRFYTDCVPLFVVLGVLGAWAAIRNTPSGLPLGRVETTLLVCTLAWGGLVNGAGAVSRGGAWWNATPVHIDENPMRAFDWKRSQFMCAFFPSLPGLRPPRANPRRRPGRGRSAGESRPRVEGQ